MKYTLILAADPANGPAPGSPEEGFYLLECADLDEALSWAAKVPTAAFGYGAVEVRPCIDYTQAMG